MKFVSDHKNDSREVRQTLFMKRKSQRRAIFWKIHQVFISCVGAEIEYHAARFGGCVSVLVYDSLTPYPIDSSIA
jgi:hypothetical protein